MSTKGENNRRFGRVLCELNVSDLDRGELAILLVICQHVSGKSDAAWPSISTLAELAGMSQRAARRAIVRLERKRRIEVNRGKGRGVVSVYRPIVATDKTGRPDDPDYGAKQVVQTTLFKGHKRGRPEQKKGSSSIVKGVVQTTPEERRKREGRQPAAATAGENRMQTKERPDTAVTRLLADRGVGEPVRSQLACNGQLTVQLIDSVQGTGGSLVTRIRERLAVLDKENKSHAARGQVQDLEHRERMRHEKQVLAERARVDAVLAKYSETERQQAVDTCIEHEQRKLTIEVWKEIRLQSGTLRTAVARRCDPRAFEGEGLGQGPQGGLKFIG